MKMCYYRKGTPPAFTTNLTTLLRKVPHLCRRTRYTIQASKLCQKKKNHYLANQNDLILKSLNNAGLASLIQHLYSQLTSLPLLSHVMGK